VNCLPDAADDTIYCGILHDSLRGLLVKQFFISGIDSCHVRIFIGCVKNNENMMYDKIVFTVIADCYQRNGEKI